MAACLPLRCPCWQFLGVTNQSHPSDSIPDWRCHPHAITGVDALSLVRTAEEMGCLFLPPVLYAGCTRQKVPAEANASAVPKRCFDQGRRGFAPVSCLRCGGNRQMRLVNVGELQPEKPAPRRSTFLLSQRYFVAFYLIPQVHSCPLVLCNASIPKIP